MNEITLEKIDIIRERTGVTYQEAKEALEKCDCNVVDALIYIESNKRNIKDDLYTTKEEFVTWLKDLIQKGNITRIKIRKDDKIIVDVPVNAGIAASVVIGIVWAPLLAIGILTAVITKVTVEVTKEDGSVEVINKIIKTSVDDVKDKVDNIKDDLKDKVKDIKTDIKDKFQKKDGTKAEDETTENVYQYTVKFEDADEDDNK